MKIYTEKEACARVTKDLSWEQRHALMWLRLAMARGEMQDCRDRHRVMMAKTATNDCPSDEMIDWAKKALTI